MALIIFFAVVIGFSLTINIIDKVRSYGKSERSVWEEGDSVVIKDQDATSEQAGNGFAQRIA